jgi:hypothetical protein
MPGLFVSLLISFTLALLAVATWSLYQRSWLLPIVIGLYLAPYLAALVLLLKPIRESCAFSLRALESTFYFKRLQAFIEPLEVFFNWDSDVGLGLPARIVSATLSSFGAILSWPIITFYGALVYRGNAQLRLRRFDASWKSLMLVFAYALSYSRHPVVGCVLAVWVVLVEVESLVSTMHLRRGVVMFFLYDESLGRVSLVVKKAFTVLFGFAALHFGIARVDPHAYNVPLTFLNSVYFSLVTFATVGYGDIVPTSAMAKCAAMMEIVSGVLTLILTINVAISVWLQEHQPTTAPTLEDRVRAIRQRGTS